MKRPPWKISSVFVLMVLAGFLLAPPSPAWAAKKKKKVDPAPAEEEVHDAAAEKAAQSAKKEEATTAEHDQYLTTNHFKMKLSLIEVFGFAGIQPGAGNSYSGGLSWKPTRRLSDSFDVRVNLGAILLSGATAKKFVAAEYELLFAFIEGEPWSIEAGGGAQSWFGNGGTHLLVSANLSMKLDEPWILGIVRVVAG